MKYKKYFRKTSLKQKGVGDFFLQEVNSKKPKVFLEVGVLLLGVSVIAEILFGPDVPFFGSQVTNNIISLLNSLGNQGTAALIIVFAVLYVYRRFLK